MTEHDGPIYLTEADVAGLVTINDAIEALQELLPEEASGQARNIPKTFGVWEPRSSAHALGAVATDDGVALLRRGSIRPVVQPHMPHYLTPPPEPCWRSSRPPHLAQYERRRSAA